MRKLCLLTEFSASESMIHGSVGPLKIVANYRFLSSNMFANDWHIYDSCALNMSELTSVLLNRPALSIYFSV